MKELKDYLYHKTEWGVLYCGDCLEIMPLLADKSVDCIITSPPYYTSQHKYQRGSGFHYSMDIGEPLYLIEDISKHLFRILKDDGAFALNLGYSYGETGIMRPFRIIERLLRDGWFPYDIIIWHKNNPVPIRNRLTNAIEYIFILTKYQSYQYKKSINYEHNVWKFPVESVDYGTATFPIELPSNCIDLLSKEGDIVFDLFMGSGTTASQCILKNRQYIGCELNADCCYTAKRRIETALDQQEIDLF